MTKPNAAWAHNSLIGGARMIQGICLRVKASRTTTGAAKVTAEEIHALAGKLAFDLATRLK